MKTQLELFFCSFGPGYYVMNRAKQVDGDFEKLAYISENGLLNFYKNVYSIPGPALTRIEHFADTVAANYKGGK